MGIAQSMRSSGDDTKENESRSPRRPGAPDPPKRRGGGTEALGETTTPAIGRRLLTLRVPVWSALAVLGLAGLVVAALLFARDPVDLGPAVDGAVEASVSLTICNETVDRRHINPRTAELDLEKGLEALGVRQAEATLTRIDCGPDGPQD
jgi:hypothetical protein